MSLKFSTFIKFKFYFSDTDESFDFGNVAINQEECLINCSENCENENCEFCANCISAENLKHLRRSHQEHVRKGEMMRIFPSIDHYDDEFIATSLSPANQFMAKWFKTKCRTDGDHWC